MGGWEYFVLSIQLCSSRGSGSIPNGFCYFCCCSDVQFVAPIRTLSSGVTSRRRQKPSQDSSLAEVKRKIIIHVDVMKLCDVLMFLMNDLFTLLSLQ